MKEGEGRAASTWVQVGAPTPTPARGADRIRPPTSRSFVCRQASAASHPTFPAGAWPCPPMMMSRADMPLTLSALTSRRHSAIGARLQQVKTASPAAPPYRPGAAAGHARRGPGRRHPAGAVQVSSLARASVGACVAFLLTQRVQRAGYLVEAGLAVGEWRRFRHSGVSAERSQWRC